MPLTLPPGVEIDPVEDSMFCQLYASTGYATKTSNIIAPMTAREELFFARVLKVGPGKFIDIDQNGDPITIPMRYEPGESVIFMRYHGERIEIEGHLYIILKQNDILARVSIDESDKGHFFKDAKVGDVDDDALAAAREMS